MVLLLNEWMNERFIYLKLIQTFMNETIGWITMNQISKVFTNDLIAFLAEYTDVHFVIESVINMKQG